MDPIGRVGCGPSSRGGGAATWHQGELWFAVGNDEVTHLFTIDSDSGEATWAGLSVPDPGIDAIAGQ